MICCNLISCWLYSFGRFVYYFISFLLYILRIFVVMFELTFLFTVSSTYLLHIYSLRLKWDIWCLQKIITRLVLRMFVCLLTVLIICFLCKIRYSLIWYITKDIKLYAKSIHKFFLRLETHWWTYCWRHFLLLKIVN